MNAILLLLLLQNATMPHNTMTTVLYYVHSVGCLLVAAQVVGGWWCLDRFNSPEGFTAHRWVSTRLGFPKNSSSCLFFSFLIIFDSFQRVP